MGTSGARSNYKCYENYDPCFPDQPVVDLYLPVWASQPAFQTKPAFIWAQDGGTRETITYQELNSSANSISSQLLKPLQRGDTLLILSSPGLDLVKILFSCQRAGLLSLPIFPPDFSLKSSTRDHLHHHLIRVLMQTKPKAAIAHSNYIASVRKFIMLSTSQRGTTTLLSKLLQNLNWLSIEDFVLSGSIFDSLNLGSSDYLGCGLEDLYLIQYTSGATGTPKPVLVTAGSAAHNVRTARTAYKLQPNSAIVSWLPQYHDCGLMFLLLTVVAGATCILTSPLAFLRRPRFWLELVTEFEATCTPVPSFALPLVLKRGGVRQGRVGLKLGSLTNLVLINEPIYKDRVVEFVREFAGVGLSPSCISPSYGLAENCTFVSTAWRSAEEVLSSTSFLDIPSYKQLLPCARLASSTGDGTSEEEEMEIVVVEEESCEAVEDGVEGEIWVSSPSNASAYLGYPCLSGKVFQGRLKGKASGIFVRTGDIGIVKGKERYLYVLGRASDIIKTTPKTQSQSQSHHFHPHYLETAAYESCPDHLRAGCIAAIQISSILVVVAELQRGRGTESGSSSGIGEILYKIDEALVSQEEGIGGEARLVALVESESLPKTTSGKMKRWEVREKFLRGELAVVEAAWFGASSSLRMLDSKEGKKEWEKADESVLSQLPNESPNISPLMSLL